MKTDEYDLIIIGAGAAGMVAAITAARDNKKVLLLEKLSQVGAKLKATGGGRCNLTNTLSDEEFMAKFGRDGRFIQDALKAFSSTDLQEFMSEIGVETHAPDGFRVFPTTHSSSTIIDAFINEMLHLNVEIKTSQRVTSILINNSKIKGVSTDKDNFYTSKVILATGGLGYPTLGAEGDGYLLSSNLGHTTTSLHPAMMPLKTKETWVSNCRADTIANATLKVDMKKHKKLRICDDLIFTKTGIRGPAVLDFARDITPLLDKYGEVPLLINLTKGMNEDEILKHLKDVSQVEQNTILDSVATLLPRPLAKEICIMANADIDSKFSKLKGESKAKLIKLLAWTPLTIIGHDGFKMAMITRGGINLKEINPKTMQSRLIDGLYFCGEVMNIDGPCGGYNLQWSFSSGYLAAKLY